MASRVVTNAGPFNGTVHTVQDRSGNVIAESDGTTGVVAKEYIWLPGAGYAGTDLPVGVVDVAGTSTPELLYVHADHLSRPIRLTDAAKVTAWAVEWLPWGGVHSITGSETLNARFPGQWFQVESGLHYNWHRHYDPSIGRYTQPDPLGFVDGPSVYAYVGNSPLELVDPDGLYIRGLLKRLGIDIDGPNAGIWYGNGRVFQIRYQSRPIFRLDYQPLPTSGGQSRLHCHIAPDISKHRCLDPRGCGPRQTP